MRWKLRGSSKDSEHHGSGNATSELRAEIADILRRVNRCAIAFRFRSNIALGSGERRSNFRGSGDDFDGLVEYAPGDDPRTIDWNATAANGGQEILRAVHLEPKDVKVFVLVDVSPSMDFGTIRATKRYLAAEMVGTVIESADKTHDRVGFVAYSQHDVELYQPTRAARRAILPALATTLRPPKSQDGTTGGSKNRSAASEQHVSKGSGLLKSLSLIPRQQRSLVFVISDFLNFTDEDRHALRTTALRHDVVCLVVEDARECELPPVWGFYTLEDLDNGERKTIFVTKAKRQKYADDFRQRETTLLNFFHEANCRVMTVSTEEADRAISRVLRLFALHARQGR